MDKTALLSILSRHGLAISDSNAGAGKFRDLYIGVGADYSTLRACQADIIAAGLSRALVKVDHCDNPQHPDHGKPHLEIGSFWWE